MAEGGYDAILTDIRMPELDGPGLYQEIARHYPHLVRRVVFITGDALSLPTREFLAQTDAPRIEKPVDVTAIRRALDQLKREPGKTRE